MHELPVEVGLPYYGTGAVWELPYLGGGINTTLFFARACLTSRPNPQPNALLQPQLSMQKVEYSCAQPPYLS